MARQTIPDGKAAVMEKVSRDGAGGDEFRIVREIIESLAIALVFAFLFKAFLVELFVIPTGSMAPTLMGFHKDVVCPICKVRFKVSASEEFPEATGHGASHSDASLNATVRGGTCPQCGTTTYLDKNDRSAVPAGVDYRSYPGDRILVSKYNYLLHDPQRWHVTVFRYPAKAQANYIKRLVGLENETVRIEHGDIFVRKDGENHFVIQRKPSRVLHAMLQLVYDTDHAVAAWHKLGWPTRWEEAAGEWNVSEDCRTYAVEASPSLATLAYRHILPSSRDCQELIAGRLPENAAVAPALLITDFTAYNAGLVRNPPDMRHDASEFLVPREQQLNGKTVINYGCYRDPDAAGHNWVGDLLFSCKVDVKELLDTSECFFELVKGGVRFGCTIDLKTGRAVLQTGDKPLAEAIVPMQGVGTYQVEFANIDEELRLWIGGREVFAVPYDDRLGSTAAGLPLPGRDRSPNELDLRPVVIGVRGAKVEFTHMKIMRDLYYIACNAKQRLLDNCDLLQSPYDEGGEGFDPETRFRAILSQPAYFHYFGKTLQVEFPIGKDEFLMLGDNSANSKDSRLWTTDGIPSPVPRELLVGEALFVYWPHGYPIPGTNLNWLPNFWQMRWID